MQKSTTDFIHLKIKRQDGPNEASYWEEFKIPYRPSQNIISCLKYIQKNPFNAAGETVVPVVYESNCLEEVCGACSMVINGQARQACSCLIDSLIQPIVLEPMDHFPIIRDLLVDRQALFDALTTVKAWIEIDGSYDLGPGHQMSPARQEVRYDYSRCMSCGCCTQSCPNYRYDNGFIGPAALGQTLLFNLHPVGAFSKQERYRMLMQKGGIFGCGNSQNCERACPKEIHLLRAISELKKNVTWQAMKDIFVK